MKRETLSNLRSARLLLMAVSSKIDLQVQKSKKMDPSVGRYLAKISKNILKMADELKCVFENILEI